MIPGEIIISDKELEINSGSEAIEVEVSNTGDRPIQVGSHYHFFETNEALKFSREKSKGMRLDITQRLRRNRKSEAIRSMVRETVLSPQN